MALLIVAILLPTGASITLRAQHSPKMPDPLPFSLSEQLVYEAEFSRSLLRGINIAEFRFRVEPVMTRATQPRQTPNLTSNAEAKLDDFRVSCEAISKGFFNKLFGLNFRFAIQSVVAPEAFLVRESRKHDEQGDRLRTSETSFDHQARRITWTERDPKSPDKAPRVVETDFGALPGTPQDLATIFYYLRTRPLTPGTDFDIALNDSGHIYRVPVRVVRRKRIDTRFGKQPAVELDVRIFGAQNLVEGEGEMTLWFTDDARHIPLRARIRHDMGTLTIKLKSRVER